MTDITTLPTSIELDFADGRYWFCLPWPQIFELEKKCGGVDHNGLAKPKSLFVMHDELGNGLIIGSKGDVIFTGGSKGVARDVAEIIRLSLVGGNRGHVMSEQITVSSTDARNLVDNYVFPAVPLVESAALAFAILNAAIHGEPKAVETPKTTRKRKAA